MNKQERLVVILLFVLLVGWGYLNKGSLTAPPKPVDGATETVVPAVETAALPSDAALQNAEPETGPAIEPEAEPTDARHPRAGEGKQREQQVRLLSNEELTVTVSSWGGGIAAVQLNAYREQLDPESRPVTLDFSAQPALELTRLAGLPALADYEIGGDDHAVLLTRRIGDMTLTRRIELGESSSVTITDTFTNDSPAAVLVPAHGVCLGPMQAIQSKAKTRGISYLGIDSLADVGGERVEYWMKTGLFHKSPVIQEFAAEKKRAGAMPPSVAVDVEQPMLWVAVKNKFFAQILVPDQPSAQCRLHAARDTATDRRAEISEVWGELLFAKRVLEPGQALTRAYNYYVGPKKYDILKQRAGRQAEIMEFGRWFGPVGVILLKALNLIYAVVRNYGIAIIVLTAIVRILFWPITHKSTESMKKMQKIQPLVKTIREKYKDKPQKMNQEVMALYKQHKVNPMAGCLPVVVQIPVFIALFTVLRSAIELRFAGFLWISDLSEPEGLLAGMIPLVGSLNILPLFMTATMAWQQRLTPSAGDPQQQKMMLMMPVIMLFVFYSMASALVLYWSTSQCLSIAQLLLQRRKSARQEAAAGGVQEAEKAEHIPPPRRKKKRK